MSRSPVPLFGLGNLSRSRPINSERRINLYSEVTQDPQRGSSIAMYSMPGLSSFSNYGAEPSRGIWSKDDSKYYVNRNT